MENKGWKISILFVSMLVLSAFGYASINGEGGTISGFVNGVFSGTVTSDRVVTGGIDLQQGNITNVSTFNDLIYLSCDSSDIGSDINSYLASGYKNFVGSGCTYNYITTIDIDVDDSVLDFSQSNLNYTGSGSAVIIDALRVQFSFNQLFNNDGSADYGIQVNKHNNGKVLGNMIGWANVGDHNFVKANIYINPLVASGNNYWEITTLQSEHSTDFGILMVAGSALYEGDTFIIPMMLKFSNAYINISAGGDLEYHNFFAGFDGGSVGDNVFIDNSHDKNAFYIKSVTNPMTGYDIILRTSADNNLIIPTQMIDLNVSNSGSANYILGINEFNKVSSVSVEQKIEDDAFLYFGDSADAKLSWRTTQTINTLLWTLSDASQSLIIGDNTYRERDYDRPQMSDPTLFLFSHNDPNVDNTQYVGLQHDGTNAKILVGKGDLQIGDGSSQKNITLTSPDGTEYSCGVANGGVFSCS